jgi:CheY-like chemotaxis protein
MKNNTDPIHVASTSEETGTHLKFGAFYAKTLLDRHQVPQSQRTKLISQATGLQYGAAHRRAKGDASWTFEELDQLARNFGETLDQVFYEAQMLGATAGEIVIGGFRRNCHFWRGKQLSATAASGTLAAKLEGMTWIVAPLGDHSPGGELFEAERPVLDQDPDLSFRIAVLDDVPEAASVIRANLVAADMKCAAFYSISALIASVNTRPYDAYVLDWLIDNGNVRDLIGQLRGGDPTAPIVILTGQAGSTEEIASGIADMVATYGVHYFSKTSETSVMVAMLRRLLGARTIASAG